MRFFKLSSVLVRKLSVNPGTVEEAGFKNRLKTIDLFFLVAGSIQLSKLFIEDIVRYLTEFLSNK